MKRTRICELFGIEYPIIQGGMGYLASAELAAAVSNAGGLGMISPTAGLKEEKSWSENLREQIRKARQLTDKPLGANISLELPDHKECLEAALKEGIRIVTTAAGSPKIYTKGLKETGVKVMHTVFSTRHARTAAEAGVDAVIASGVEGGGLLSRDELTTLVLIPQVADTVKIPIIAAGGIADARGLVAALALGAEGVQMGSRVIATKECIAHPNYKEAIVKAIDTDTTITGRKSLIAARTLKNEFVQQVLEKENAGASPEELSEFIGLGRLRLSALEGNMKDGSAMCGAIAGAIKEILSVAEVVRSIVEGYDQIVANLR